MITNTEARQDYFKARPQGIQPYLRHERPKLTSYEQRDEIYLVKPREPRVESLESLLDELQGEELADRIYTVREGREARFFDKDPLLPRLVRAIRTTSNARSLVERLLDHLFEDLRRGEYFIHTEIVMFLLLALKRAGVAFFPEIATVFAETKTSELGRLRRFARALLEQ